jgi:hypothetical protein
MIAPIFPPEMKQALIALEDGRVFHGEPFGAEGTAVGEICFNTTMTGYQEVLTDPSYRGQIVAMTYPLIGNYGVNGLDDESLNPHVRGFVVGELSAVTSNWRANGSLDDYLKRWRRHACANQTSSGSRSHERLHYNRERQSGPGGPSGQGGTGNGRLRLRQRGYDER